MEIYKFGGTSVGTAENISRVVNIVQSPGDKIVVLSANGKSTDRLVELIDFVSDGNVDAATSSLSALENYYLDLIDTLFTLPEATEKATHALNELLTGMTSCFDHELTETNKSWLLTRGELFSTIIFSLYLEEQDIEHRFMHATDIIHLNENKLPDTVKIKTNLCDFLANNPGSNTIVTQGFICCNDAGQIETLGRGGSDLTASLLGAAAEASVIQIWSDVDGFLNNDPGFVRGALPLTYLSFDEAAELAYFGARVLHPATLHPARVNEIPVLLKNTMKPEARGTIISARQQHGTVKAVAAKDNIYSISIHSDRMLMAHGFLRKVFQIFENYETAVDMVTTSEVSVSVTIDNPKYIEQITAELEELGDVNYTNGLSIICVVGDNLSENRGKVSQVFTALEGIPLRMISYGAAKNSISFLVETNAKINALESLNKLLTASYQNQELYV